MPSDDDRLDRTFHALADPTRRHLHGLVQATPGLTTGELAERTPGMTRWAVMKHITVLRRIGLVLTLPDGRRRRHYADATALDAVRAWLDASAHRGPRS